MPANDIGYDFSGLELVCDATQTDSLQPLVVGDIVADEEGRAHGGKSVQRVVSGT